jgi:PD-(D/E)XK endonuclease
VRVQVKSTYVTRGHVYSVTCGNGPDSKKKSYTSEEIDFLVAYIVAEDTWYVVPIAAFEPLRQLRLYPSGCRKKNSGRYEKYREAWDLMKETPDDRTLTNSRALGELRKTT